MKTTTVKTVKNSCGGQGCRITQMPIFIKVIKTTSTIKKAA